MEILYEGDFVLTKNGSKDFGEITPEISKIICRQAGKIRFQKGFQNPKNDRDGFGEAHFKCNGIYSTKTFCRWRFLGSNKRSFSSKRYV